MRIKRWVATGPGGLDDFVFIDDDLPLPGPGEVTIEVRAAGVNPADLKHAMRATSFPLPIGYEVSGVIAAIGPDVTDVSVGDEVLAFRVSGGYSIALNVPASKVFAKPGSLAFDAASNLLLAGCTASEMLWRSGARAGDVILLHGASGAVGVAVLQLARLAGVAVMGTCGPSSFGRVRQFGGVPIEYGPSLLDRVQAVTESGVVAALDAAGTDEAIDVSLALVADHSRIITVANPKRAKADGFVALAGSDPVSARYRDSVRGELVELAGSRQLIVPMAGTYPLVEAPAALTYVRTGHAGGKVSLIA